MDGQGESEARDIEEQLSDAAASTYTGSPSPLPNNASPTDENPADISGGQVDAQSSKGFLAKSISKLCTLVATIFRFLLLMIWGIILSLLAIISVVYNICSIFITGDSSYLYYEGYAPNHSEEDDNNQRGSRIKAIQMKKKPAIKLKIHRLTVLTAVRMGCVVLSWFVINLRVASFQRLTVLGSLLWKWSLLVAVILLAYPILMSLFDKISSVVIEELCKSYRGSNIEYCMEGTTQSLILALYFSCLLLVWLLCVDTSDAYLHKYGTLTLVSFLVGGVLTVVKSLVLLWWRTKLIYKKYKGKILAAGCQLFFNLLLMDQDAGGNMLVEWMDWANYTPKEFVPEDPKSKEIEDHKERPKRRKIQPIEEYMLKKGASIRHVHDVATYLTNNFELSLTEDDDIPDIVPYLRRTFRIGLGPGYSITAPEYKYSIIGTLDVKLMIELLQLETSNVNPTYADFEKWMVDGLKYCYAVGNRIDGAFEVMRILNRVMTTFIVVVVVLIWLFITGLATTKVVVGLASIFLGLSFVFGDACKTFFQGAIFSFVTHPFDVADRCIIDDKELKVKKINILTTTFFGNQSKEIILYPNSDLATKRIMLVHGERDSEHKPEVIKAAEAEPAADLMDLVEFSLPSKTTSVQIESLQENIERHLADGFQAGVYKKSYSVALVEVGDCIKMCVHFEHVLNGGDRGEHLDSIEIRKKKQRSIFLLQLKKFLEKIGN